MIARIASIFLFLYALILGAHFRGILHPDIRLFSLILLALVVGVWLLVRTRARWRWHATPLDIALPFWILAFVVSTLANPETARRSLLALWYMGVYIGLWYMLHDILANGGLTRRTLVDMLLFGGGLMVGLGIPEFQIAQQSAGGDIIRYRLSGILTNPNTTGTYLAVFIVFLLGSIISTRLLVIRIAIGIFAALATTMLFLTYSRSAWLGLGAGVLIGGLLLLANRGRLRPADARRGWQRLPAVQRLLLIFMGALGLIIGGGVAIRLASSFLGSERGLSLRPELFRAAGEMFSENPLFGQGLFSFGQHMGRFFSIPPQALFSHPHSVPVQIAAELGLLGIIAALVTLFLICRATRRNWLAATGTDRILLITAAAASVAFATIHMIDVTAMLPVLALTGLITLVVLTAPSQPRVIAPRAANSLRSGLLVGGWLLLFGAGLWDSQLYARYFEIIAAATTNGTYHEAADALQSLSDADPMQAAYPAQQGFLWGLATSAGDDLARDKAISAYEKTIALEPYYAPYYVNLAALYWQAGEQQQGLETMQQAAALAPESWPIQYNLGTYAETLGQTDIARTAYQQALIALPDADLHPAWGQTTLQAELHSDFEDRSPEAQFVVLMEAGRNADAIALWEQINRDVQRHAVLRELLALSQGDLAEAQQWYAQTATTYQEMRMELWPALGKLMLAEAQADEAATQAAQQTIDSTLRYEANTRDFESWLSLAQHQYFRQVLARQFLPDVFYPTNEPLLLYVLATT